MYGFLTLAPLQMAPGSWRRRSSRRRTRAKPSLLREAQLQGALPDLRHCPPGYLALRQHAREGQADTVARSDFSAGAGELGAHHVPAKQLCSTIPSNGPATSRRSVSLSPIGPRAAAHVVRQPRHHALVGRHVAHEGFAALLHSTSRPSKVETEDWRMWDPVRGGQHPMVFALDRCQTANALTQSSQHSAEASASFGTVTYSKGTVTSADSQSVSSRTGASAASTKPYENKRRFLFKGTSTEQYIVPLTWAAQGDSFEFSTPTVYLEKSSPLVGINMPPEDKWVIFNVQETGYYRVNYDEKNWNLISKYLNDHANPIDDIHYLNRAQLLDDSFNLARAGYLKYKTTLGLADYLSRETDYIPWAAAYSAFSYLNRMLVNHPKYPVFQRYISQLLDKAYQQIEITFLSNSAPESHDEKLLMNRITSLACIAELESCVGHVHRRLLFYISSSESVHQDQRSVVYCYGIRHSPDFFWTSLWQMYQSSTDDVERGLIIAEFVTKFKDELGSTGYAALAVVDDNLQWLSTHAEEIFRILEDKELQMYRLPQSVIPNHYTIFIDAALEHVSFTGDISILVTAMEATEVILLHAEGVSGQNIVVKAVDDDNNLYESDSFDVTHQLMKIHLTRPLIKGKVYEISMFFAGPLRRDMYGFYLSSYTNEKGEQIQLAATQFQPTYARRAFPCFDEPNFKATFSLNVRAPEYYHVLSNMPSIETVRSAVDDAVPDRTFDDGEPVRTFDDGEPVRTFDDGEPDRTVDDGEPDRTVDDGEPDRTVDDAKPDRTVDAQHDD
ncbi:Aminopeptidase 2 [Gryllus bimaculatus]|nr:Aminopeptidase 2 [Gryllus bimaculatus]